MSLLNIANLHVKLEDGTELLKGVDLQVNKGEVHVVMGPNGSGKSTLAKSVMGHPAYIITGGTISFNGEEIQDDGADERAKKGLFMAFQYPKEIAGVQLDRFLFQAYTSITKARGNEPMSVFDFNKKIHEEAEKLKMNKDLLTRDLNHGFSGGEKKKAEMLQLALLEPTIALLDETDSGLDVDALRIVGEAATRFRSDEKALVIVTHYNRILEYIEPDKTHLMINGKIVESGGAKFAHELEANGYEQYVK